MNIHYCYYNYDYVTRTSAFHWLQVPRAVLGTRDLTDAPVDVIRIESGQTLVLDGFRIAICRICRDLRRISWFVRLTAE